MINYFYFEILQKVSRWQRKNQILEGSKMLKKVFKCQVDVKSYNFEEDDGMKCHSNGASCNAKNNFIC